MPLFFFETREGRHFVPDTEGLDLADRGSAEREARQAIADMARDTIARGQADELAVMVRGSNREPLFAVKMSLKCVEWREPG